MKRAESDKVPKLPFSFQPQSQSQPQNRRKFTFSIYLDSLLSRFLSRTQSSVTHPMQESA